jgi:hypothetical protein
MLLVKTINRLVLPFNYLNLPKKLLNPSVFFHDAQKHPNFGRFCAAKKKLSNGKE